MKMFRLSLLFFAFMALLVPTQAQEKSAPKAFKGIELYSWQDSKGQWLFALLFGTNRLKSEAEIKRQQNQLSSTEELERRFARLAKGEEIFWQGAGIEGFAYPEKNIVEEVASSARKAKVNLRLPPNGE